MLEQQFDRTDNEYGAEGSSGEFAGRHIGPNEGEIRSMLESIGCADVPTLIDRAVPPDIRSSKPLDLPLPLTEAEAMTELRSLAAENRVMRSFIGLGYYGTHTPSVIVRRVLENPAWYTAYTPYQPEISQGRLEALLNFQTMVADLTGLEVANASLLDEATAAAEAMTLCRRISKSKSDTFFVDEACYPQTIEVIRTRALPIGIEIVTGDISQAGSVECFGALFQYPGADGDIPDLTDPIAQVRSGGGLAVVAADLLALTTLRPPGEIGADVAVGTTQRFGVPMGFGGPHAAYIATKDSHKRQVPGRIVGQSIDANGDAAFRLALQTREQHIRREKATSNICTAQVLLAVIASFYACYHGPVGLRRIAARVHRLTATLAAGLRLLDFEVANRNTFDTVTIRASGQAYAICATAEQHGCNLRKIDADRIGIALDETTTRADVELLWKIFAEHASSESRQTGLPDFQDLYSQDNSMLPKSQLRTSAYLEHPVFNSHHSETQMLRYIAALAAKDLALDRTMIPLGSCTMKLNAATEMEAITWPEFSNIHPFAPHSQTRGYAQLIEELERMLCACTGYDAVSLQPNAGSQGEYAGLLAIRAWHASRGDTDRTVCLIPNSAHGTNPASAQMAGMRVVVVKCDEEGNVDLDDLEKKAADHAAQLGAIMITYPSTHGVFEPSVRKVCEIVHAAGGQVFIDGANLNATVGIAALAEIGGDVSHLNLHKTFCIPHGGGGPGVGPVAVKSHLAPYLPGHQLTELAGSPAVAAAPFGSASILPISWAYIRMMGGAGLKLATEIAILNANYIAERLRPHYPVLYTGPNELVAHECILDLRPLKASSGITVDDVAKRLIDFGFHAPTMSFPVPGTLMIEPTESESKDELDRFCDAMIAIRAEIEAVATGAMPLDDNPLVNAPHTVAMLVADWTHPYTRATAVFPSDEARAAKYFAPVARIDNVYGDRNFVCTCPPMSEYIEPEAAAHG